MASRSRRQRKKTKHYTDDDPATFTTKEKRGSNPPQAPSPVKKRPRPVKRSHRRIPPPPQHVSLSHHVRMVPLFNAPEAPHSAIFGRGLGIPLPLKKPEWEEIPPPLCYFPQVIDESSCNTPVLEARAASCSCLASNDTYLAMGDTAGFVSIYALQPKLLSVARLTTTASNRERSSNLKLPPSKKFRLYEKKTHPNQIDKVSITGNRVVLSTKHEVELLDVRENIILWSFALDIPCQSLDIHLTTHQVLCSFAPDTKNDATTPLWLLDGAQSQSHTQTQTEGGKFKGNKTLVQPTNDDTTLSLGHRCAAIWDKSNINYFLMVTLVMREDGSIEQDLLKLDKNTFQVVQQTPVPNKPSGKSTCHTVECLSQSPSGYLTLVSSTKGIRMLETSSLQLLRVFGDSVALHGHSLTFQQCLFISKPRLPNQMDDLLDERQRQAPIHDKNWATQNVAYLIGIPFANREPRELRDTLHLWELWDGKHTTSTVLAPTRSDGFRSVTFAHDKLIAATQTGSCFIMAPTVQSDFPGIMYPPGYQVINDNLEYIEDEDDVDVVMTTERMDHYHDVVDDDQIAEAVRLSMMEQSTDVAVEVETIDVVGDDEEVNPLYIPCHPESFLKQSFQNGSSPLSVDSHDYLQPKSFASSLLRLMPHADNVTETKQSKPTLDEPKIVVSKPIRTKRSKAASLETLLKSSLDPNLRKVMMARQLPAKGSGSRHVQNDSIHDYETSGSPDGASYKWGSNGSNGETMQRSIDLHSENYTIMPPLDGRSPLVGENTTAIGAREPTKNGTAAINGNESHATDINKDSTYAENNAAAALLMSACGELDSPSQAEQSKLEESEPKADRPVSHGTSHSPSNYTAPAVVDTNNKCFACRGRWVFHSCGKKDKPVDYDELLKAEEEKREQEEEEKRKARAEKRRIADAKRREARKKKKLEEDSRFQREEMERIRWEKEHRQQQLERSRVNNEDKDRRRVDMLQRLQAEQTTVSLAPSDWPPPVQSYGKLQAPSTYQSYSTTHSNWPPPSQNYESTRGDASQPSPYATDWPAPANHSPEQTTTQTQIVYSSKRTEWSQQSPTLENQTGSDSQYRGAKGWPEPTASGVSYHSKSHEQSPPTSSVTVQIEGEQPTNDVGGSTQYSSNFYETVPAATEGIGQPTSAYAAHTPKATSETIDPAEALASLAMFAIAAPKVEVTEDYGVRSDYRAVSSNQCSEQHAVQSSFQEGKRQSGQEYQSNGWSNSKSHPERGER